MGLKPGSFLVQLSDSIVFLITRGCRVPALHRGGIEK